MITIGDELLAGDTVNTNAAWLGRELSERGVTVGRIIVVPDRVSDIAKVVNEMRAEFDAVIVTGGLGPTHDDVTIEGVAAGLGIQVVEHADAVDWIDEHSSYTYSELVDGTADLPSGSRMIPNTEGVAPGAVIEGDDDVPVYVLPGVPKEMKAMFAQVADEFAGAPRYRRFVPVAEPESALIDRVQALSEEFGVTVGSYPGEEVVRIRIEGGDEGVVQRAEEWLRERVDVAD